MTNGSLSADSEAANTDLSDRLHDAKLQLKSGDLVAASATLQQLLETSPSHRDGLYYLAVCQRQASEVPEALETLATLLSEHALYGRAWQEYGHLLSSKNQLTQSADAYRRAVALNPALIASWKALVLYHNSRNEMNQAREAMQHAQWLAHLPPELLTVSSLIYEDKLYVAEQICRAFLRTQPKHVEGMRLLAEIGTKLQILDDAELLLQHCVEFEPNYLRARLEYVQVLHKRQKFQLAQAQAKQLLARDPDNIGFELTLAGETQAIGDFECALEMYEGILAKNNSLALAHTARGHALKTIGKTNDAIEAYQQAYQCRTDFGDAFWSLANLKTYQFSAAEIHQMREQERGEAIAESDRIHLCFALGKALEDAEAYSASFDYYQRGNRLKYDLGRYNEQQLLAETERSIQLFTADFFSQHPDKGCLAADPIFVVGLPRAGSTLLEQILASHSQVDGTLELANIIGMAHHLRGRNIQSEPQTYPAVLAQLDRGQLLHFGEQYIEDTRFHRQGGAFFIDKMPNNFRHIGLIQLILPNAKIIDARREPMACCFSGFKQLFAEGQEFSYSLESMGRYYRSYVELMAHWDAVLPGKILRVQHEDVVADLEGQVRRILDYCQLPFEPQCVDFHETQRAVRTPSSEQVRQPIYQSGLQQWQNYAQYLQPLEQALGPALKAYR